eukprot:1758221-Alexandrium_andersonii.AAC.1
MPAAHYGGHGAGMARRVRAHFGLVLGGAGGGARAGSAGERGVDAAAAPCCDRGRAWAAAR